MMMRRNKVYILICIVGFFACKKETIPALSDSPIIESYLQRGQPLIVKIKQQIPFDSSQVFQSDNINNLSVKISERDIAHLLKPIGAGIYVDSTFIAQGGVVYNLSFSYNNKPIAASTFIPDKPLNFTLSVNSIKLTKKDSSSPRNSPTDTIPPPLEVAWRNIDATNYLLVIENLETTLVPIRYFGNRTPPSNRFRKQPTTGSGIEIQSREFTYFGRHRIILYHVNADYATLYSNSSTSSLNLTNPSTEITNGYGIFTGINSDTLYLQVIQK
jgi:hypothetical protein